MIRRTRTALALTAVAALAAAGSASAAPGTPVLGEAGPFVIGSSFEAHWSAASFTNLSIGRHHQLEVRDLTDGVTETFDVPAGQLSRVVNGRANGHQQRLRVRAVERLCVAVLPGPPSACLAHSPLETTGAWSNIEIFRMDATDPTGTLSINGGAIYTTSRSVGLNMTATDPLSAGQPSSGIDGVQISQDAVFTCNVVTDSSECPVSLGDPLPYTLDEGPDGNRTVRVRYRDKAREYAPTGLVVSVGAKGNASAVVTDTIILDRSKPTPVVVTGVPSADAGVPVAFSASSSTDATSGVDTSSAVWDFGDGTPPVNALQLNKSFANPGTYNGTLTIKDKAGNANTQAFSMTVTGAPAPGGGGVQVTDPGTPANPGGPVAPGTGATPGTSANPDVIRGAKRLNRAVQGKTLRIRVRVAERATVRVSILRIAASGKAVVRNQVKTGGPGFVVFTFRTAPKHGRHIVRIRSGADTLSFPMGIAKR